MKIDRLIGILSVLLQRDKTTTAELAEKFEVSRRTILRDVETLNLAGIPIVSEQGKGGGISIMSGYKVDRTLLTSEDMRAILAGLRSLDSVSGSSRYRQLMEKISPGDQGVSAGEHITVDLSGWSKAAVADKIGLIKSAMERQRRITFRYFSPGGESVRQVEPLRLLFRWSSWYLWGFCTERRDGRLFKLSRMAELAETDLPCTEPDPPEYVPDSLNHSPGEVSATVRFDPAVKWRVIDDFGTELPQFSENDEVTLTFTWSDAPSLYRYILTFGDNAEILDPPEFRAEFAELVKKIIERYEI